MKATVTNLAQWKHDHPPAIRCATAMVRCWWNWYSLAWSPWWITKR